MADKFKKIAREFLLTDSTLNVYKYRLLTSGYQLDEFKKNPIGYKMHLRDDGVVVKWEDFRIDGDKVFAKPVVNLSNPKGQQVADELENGFLNAASVGHIVALEISSNPSDYLKDQSGPTISKWFNRECSLVDIPGNYNALADLFDVNDQKINLSDFKSPQLKKMKQVFLTPESITKLNLKADSTQEDFNTTVANLVAEAAKVPDLASQLNTAQTAKQKAEDDLADLKKTTSATQVKDLLATALNVDKKITKELSVLLATKYEGKPADLKDLLDALPAYTGIVDKLAPGKEALSAKTWDELDKGGELENLKASNPDQFYDKYEQKFGKPHPDKK